MQTLQAGEDPTSYSIGSCNRHRGTVLASGWCTLSDYLS